ncbi:DUF1360 domain-containing protein [Rhodococcus hoagii]|uniref:DUF1360 domain-containing protein n=2 Tax=Rhodococcus hoagii TaxID=43767 RepID=A0A9Q5RQA4_RHOHA|nr:DUF1360 domain-containing protein [Prescottella equi]GBF17031.1 sporulation protein YjcA [Rhodococcus sp. Br-6]AVP66892.1 DUF1360 domain-containing protein [Prescottella equi]MBM4483076.1 DUF1360 domain-containing protein [Prescottella equi]MBM4490032.1 DUF1360 domain-containing protein [Prescottella equi]MBM4501111.1 DUF1360 domain-containing protein [Prescottella equi]
MVEDNASHAGHLSTLALYGLSVAATVGVATVTKRPLPGRMRMRDLVVAAAAAQKLSRTVTKSSVTRPLRAPFAEPVDGGGPGEVADVPAGKGLRSSIGELLTCPFCMDVWAISGLTAGRVFAPAATGVVTDALAALAGADFLQLAYARAQQAAE